MIVRTAKPHKLNGQKDHKFSWEFTVKGFGPFDKLSKNTLQLNSSKVAIYSGNGQGKTCLSRLFRSAEIGSDALKNGIVTRGQNNGFFEFAVKENNEEVASLKIRKKRDSNASIDNDTSYLYHVFNNDYVRENLAESRYMLSDKIKGIEGYIIGKENIDISEKRAKLEQLDLQDKEIYQEIEKAVSVARETLLSLKIRGRLTEMKNLDTDTISKMHVSESNYDSKLVQYQKLGDLPNNSDEQISSLNFDTLAIDLNQITEMLETSYTRDQFSEEFIAAANKKQRFIELGMELKEGSQCPFCGQELGSHARALIQQYEKYLTGKEAEIIRKLSSYHEELDLLIKTYDQFLTKYSRVRRQFEERKQAFPETAKTDFPNVTTCDEFENAVKKVEESISIKIKDIATVCSNDPIESLMTIFKRLETNIESMNTLIKDMNSKVSNKAEAIRNVGRELCREMAQKVRNEQNPLVSERLKIIERRETLKQEIKEITNRSEKPKRETVAEMFSQLLGKIFGNKYTFDPNSFLMKFHNDNLGEEAEQILSDGEKSVVAFCHYLATTPELLEEINDVNQLFFVIDDPVSSLDYHYAYHIAQIIKNLNTLFDSERDSERVRVLVLTHNSAFFNVLTHNSVTREHFTLDSGTIETYKGSLVPYIEHLKDIYKIVRGEKPKHTTGNSIRQIIETLWRFDNPTCSNLWKYLLKTEKCADLAECEYIYILCQDQSHGVAPSDREQPISEASVRRACQTVLNHIKRHYPGQLSAANITLTEPGEKDEI